jgi:hypothetical protein
MQNLTIRIQANNRGGNPVMLAKTGGTRSVGAVKYNEDVVNRRLRGTAARNWVSLITIEIGLEWALRRNAKVFRLFVGQMRELDSKLVQMQTGDLLIQPLG